MTSALRRAASAAPDARHGAARAVGDRDFTRLDKWCLVALGVFTVVVLAGFASFGRHPELLARFPSSRGFYATAYEVFARGHVALAFAVIAVLLIRRTGVRWLPALVAAGTLSLGMELLGTSTGFPFSGYRYTELLGWSVLGRVPVLIPFSWFMMAFPSYAAARRLVGGRVARWMVGAALLTIWDLTLDPAMSDLTPYWVWESRGAYYGMPLVNLAGWFGTGLLIMAAFDAVRTGPVADRVPVRLMEAYYATVLALSVAMTLVAGYWLAVAATVVALAAVKRGAPWMEARLSAPAPDRSGLVQGSARADAP